jgi:hypothetical protein
MLKVRSKNSTESEERWTTDSQGLSRANVMTRTKIVMCAPLVLICLSSTHAEEPTVATLSFADNTDAKPVEQQANEPNSAGELQSVEFAEARRMLNAFG